MNIKVDENVVSIELDDLLVQVWISEKKSHTLYVLVKGRAHNLRIDVDKSYLEAEQARIIFKEES